MALNGAALPRGSAAATAVNLRRRKTSGPWIKISPDVLVMSIGYIAFVVVLHVMGNLYFARREV